MDEFSFKKMRTWGQSKIMPYCYLCLVWIRRNRREVEFKIPLCNPSGGNLPRQSCTQNSVKHQWQSSSVKTANSLICWLLPRKCSTTDLWLDCKCGSDWRCCECGVRVDCQCMEFVAGGWESSRCWMKL